MKNVTLILASILLGAVAFADPLKKEYIGADAKWVAHLDIEKLLTTQLGDFIGREFLDKQLAKPARDLKEQFAIDVDWRAIQSLTAYGTDFKQAIKGKGVLIVKSKLDFAETIDGLIEKLAAHLGEEKAPLQRIQDEPFALYTIKGNLFGAPAGKDLFLLSRSQDQLMTARAVISGNANNLTSTNSFPGLRDTAKGFVIAAVADSLIDGVKLPPPAQGLKNAEGGQLMAGETADRVFLNLALNTKDAESATQMQQVFQGLVAMAALGQAENQDLQKLVQATKVSGAEKVVSVNVELPIADVIAKVNETQRKRKK